MSEINRTKSRKAVVLSDPKGLKSFALSTLRNLRINQMKRECATNESGKGALPYCDLLREFEGNTNNNNRKY